MSKKHKRQEREASYAAADAVELARATRPGKIVLAYNPLHVYSLSGAGVIRSSMTFRRDAESEEDDNFTHGSSWHVREVGVSLEAFKARYSSLGFEVREHEKPRRINYEKDAKVGRKKEEASSEEKQEQLRVLELRVAGRTFKEIEEELGWDEEGKRAAKVYREAMS